MKLYLTKAAVAGATNRITIIMQSYQFSITQQLVLFGNEKHDAS